MLYLAKSGHPGGSLSAVEAIVALYFHHMNHTPKNPNDPNRDRFVLSKGHAAPTLYAALAECGYFDVEELKHLRQINCMLQGHPVCRHIPGVEASTGSLGHGLSFSIGIALAGKLDKRTYRVYTMVGDGRPTRGRSGRQRPPQRIINWITSLVSSIETSSRSMGTPRTSFAWSPYGTDGAPSDGT